MNAKAFEPLELQYDKATEVSEYIKKELTPEQVAIIKNLTRLIDGFQSALSLEILASVDFVRKEHPGIDKTQIVQTIQNWSKRKSKLFGEKYISIALNHLVKYEQSIGIS